MACGDSRGKGVGQHLQPEPWRHRGVTASETPPLSTDWISICNWGIQTDWERTRVKWRNSQGQDRLLVTGERTPRDETESGYQSGQFSYLILTPRSLSSLHLFFSYLILNVNLACQLASLLLLPWITFSFSLLFPFLFSSPKVDWTDLQGLCCPVSWERKTVLYCLSVYLYLSFQSTFSQNSLPQPFRPYSTQSTQY